MRGQEIGIPEIEFLDEMEQFTNPKKFVNTGFNIITSSESIDGDH